MTTIKEKADHVRVARPARGHHCHWPGCAEQVTPAKWGCSRHWFMLPLYLRNKIWSAYKPGQEETQSPSRKYLDVAREVQAWIASHTGAR